MQQEKTVVPKPLGAEPEADLPNPELNPLVNPIMGRHLGRWAEVYFTTGPEERESALYKLLEDLKEEEGENASVDNPACAGVAPSYALVCARCERTNVRPQKYCGLCGALMPLLAETAPHGDASEAPAAVSTTSIHAENDRDLDNVAPMHTSLSTALSAPDGGESAAAVEPVQASILFQESVSPNVAFEAPAVAPKSSVPQPVDVDWLRQQKLASDAPTKSSWPAMRLAVVVVALCLAVLLYRHWNGTTTNQGATAQAAPEAEIAPAKSAPVDAGTRETTVNAAPTNRPPQSPPTPHAASGPHIVPTSTKPVKPPKPAGEVPSAATRANAAAPGHDVSAALWLMSDKNPKRNSKEAANLLWKAVGKDNSNALLPLSDLYARGDGVPRNCAQAQLLAKAAAQRGVPSAQEKLQHITSCR